MESSPSKEEVLKPVILKAGIPLAVTFGGLIYTWIIAKRFLPKPPSLPTNEASSNANNNSQQGEEETCLSLASMVEEDDDDEGDSYIENPCFEEDINSLRSAIEGMKMKEMALRLQFDQFCGLREQELVLGEIKNALSLEIARVGFLDREISSMEAEHKRLEDFVMKDVRVVKKIEKWRSENRLLRKRLKKVVRRSMAKSRVVKEQALMMKAEEAEILRCHEELRMKVDIIDELEDEIKKLQNELDELQDQKNKLVKKIDTLEEGSHESKIEVSREDYNHVMNELEHVKKEQADQVKELIHLRWTNACLRHEITRHHDDDAQENHQHRDNNIELDHGGGGGGVTHYDSEHDHSHDDDSSFEHHSSVPHFGSFRHSSKRGKLLRRIKRWVEGTETSKT
ncbi:hypothetical protein PIB30_016625 [Stylosanthes scabra]|uniref:Protein CHUP1, chloroplastic n=1 Tax=Stylosanthes scabra TaxID=79078 RepID=A0ABU6U671_9FABA|nr:hypothetical protein [Stylosanthes scabra]